MKHYVMIIFWTCCFSTGLAQKFKFTDQGFKISTKIENANGNTVGSGIFYEDSTSIYLISAKHVFFKLDGFRKLMLKDEKPIINYAIYHVRYFDRNYLDTLVNKLVINFSELIKNPALIKYNNDNDLIAIKVATKNTDEGMIYFSEKILNYTAKGFSPTIIDRNWVAALDEIDMGTDAWIIGYPETLNLAKLDQYDFSLPLLQKGIVSGKYDKRGTMIINAPVYPGNSGGPVFGHIERNEIKVIGIAVEFIPFVEKISQNTYGGVISQELSNSGYSVVESIDKIIKLISE